MEVVYNYIVIPGGAGSQATTSREKLSILNTSSVNRIVNRDNNCFWYALTNVVYENTAKYREIIKGRKIRETAAKELCSSCGCVWNKPVS